MGLVCGIFVGGRSRRMGGHAKGLLPGADGVTALLVTLIAAARAAGLEIVLVGDATPYEELALSVPALADKPKDTGPLGGLGALLEHGGESDVITLACDMPYVNGEVLKRLAAFEPEAGVVCPRRGPEAPWEPMFARWRPSVVAPALAETLAAGERSFQRLLRRLDVVPLASDPTTERALRDWDTPEDVARGREL